MTPERWRRVTELFHAALEREGTARETFLAEECAGDLSLRREIDRLLASHAEAGSFMEKPDGIPEVRSLPPGVVLASRYRIGRFLAQGGMGEVYQAADLRLSRDVAVKVLPYSFSKDPDRLRRFEQEARTAGSLNHPNILAVYDVGSHEGAPYVVSELLEGVTLREKLAGAALPASTVVDLAIQIARGVAAAHDKGIVHRDLKPENLFLTKEGQVKVLDFGLAKLVEPEAARDASELKTAGTTPGMILGTVGYMSPEQVRGLPVDHRSDLFSFGAIVYEMLAGRPAFKRETPADTMTAMLTAEPPEIGESGAATALERIVRRCLQKDPDARFRSMRDVAFALEAVSGRSEPADGKAPSGSRAVLNGKWGLAFAGAGVLAVLLGLAAFRLGDRPQAGSQEVRRFVLPPPHGLDVTSVAMSRSGRFLVMAADKLYVHYFNQLTSKPLPGTDGANAPFVAPDERWVGFFADGKLKKIGVDGGAALSLSDVGFDTPGASWGEDGSIFFTRGWTTGLSLLPAEGGTPRNLTQVERQSGERGHWWAAPLPGGTSVLFTVWMAGSGLNDAKVAVLDLATKERRFLFAGARAQYLASGHILYFHAGGYRVVPFDPRSLRVTGEPVTVLSDALEQRIAGTNQICLSVSDEGHLAYLPGPLYPKTSVAWLSAGGGLTPLGLRPAPARGFRLSPDGRHFTSDRFEGGAVEIWISDVERKTDERLAIPGSNFAAVWHPGGERLSFLSVRKGDFDVYSARLDGSDVQPIATEDSDEWPLDITSDGQRLLFRESQATGSIRLVVTDPARTTARQVIASVGEPHEARFSPDDRWIAYSAAPSGRREVYVQAYPGADAARTQRISSGGGETPYWMPDGRIVFRRNDTLVSVAVSKEQGRLSIGNEQALFERRGVLLGGVAPDGRLLVGLRAEPETQPGVRVVLNWFEDLRRAAGGRR